MPFYLAVRNRYSLDVVGNWFVIYHQPFGERHNFRLLYPNKMDQPDGNPSDKTELGHALESTGSESTQQAVELTQPKRDIGAFQIIALGFNIPNSWLAVAVAFSTALTAGGPVSLIYGNLVITAMYGSAAVTLAELASVYPTAGGQYHFASIMAPKRFNKSISYVCGMIATVSWIICSASVCSVTSLCIAAIAEFYNGFQASAWQLFLISQALNVISLLYNLFLLKKTHWIHDAACKSRSLHVHGNMKQNTNLD